MCDHTLVRRHATRLHLDTYAHGRRITCRVFDGCSIPYDTVKHRDLRWPGSVPSAMKDMQSPFMRFLLLESLNGQKFAQNTYKNSLYFPPHTTALPDAPSHMECISSCTLIVPVRPLLPPLVCAGCESRIVYLNRAMPGRRTMQGNSAFRRWVAPKRASETPPPSHAPQPATTNM